ncbi:hypothetical protein K5V07_10625 [Flavobacterium sp. CHNK8]|uniref:hypothetical protein n=1 Tax=Flavobacterium sp. CHNK8 TaxID=2871165 RepID=UPI001C8E03C0|nr:hypothetical protein [Flavobacterium sp. CHNK8]QZK90916.1 hypothetical protein K5V07_10625 [Flavobacterium sp. CHNK8]
METKLKNIITKVYKVFNYTRPQNINNVCTACCLDINDARLLLTTELKLIPVELICDYNDGAQAYNYDMVEFKYFLPRYLELISEYEFTSAVDVSLSLKNLNFNNRTYWSTNEEVQCINEFFLAFFEKCLETDVYNNEAQLIEIINMFYLASIDVQPYLEIWLQDLSNFSIIHLEQLITNNFNYRGKIRTNSFIDSDLNSIIENWIIANKKTITTAIENQIMATNLKEEQLQRLSYLYDTMNYL